MINLLTNECLFRHRWRSTATPWTLASRRCTTWLKRKMWMAWQYVSAAPGLRRCGWGFCTMKHGKGDEKWSKMGIWGIKHGDFTGIYQVRNGWLTSKDYRGIFIRLGWYSSSMIGLESQGWVCCTPQHGLKLILTKVLLESKSMWAVSEHFQLVFQCIVFSANWMVKFNLPSGTLDVMLTYVIFFWAARQPSLQPLPRGDCGNRNVCDAGGMQPSELAGHLHPIKSALWEPTCRFQVLWEANCRHLQRNRYVTGSISGWEWPDLVGPCMASPL